MTLSATELTQEAAAPTPPAPETLTYATGAQTSLGRTTILTLENLLGRFSLMRKGLGYQDDMAEFGISFWEAIRRRYDLKFEFPGEGLANIPRSGPLICVANHPFGILDGLAFGHILSETRGDFQILANSVFLKAPEIDPHILPIDFAETREALAQNLATRKKALSDLRAGGCLGVFPGGTVSTGRRFYSRAFDPEWKTFTAKLILNSDAQVVPIYFDGVNSRMFQIASHVSDTLRLGLLLPEFAKRVGGTLRIMVGEPVPRAVIESYRGDARALMAYLREHTYSLSPTPLRTAEIGKQW